MKSLLTFMKSIVLVALITTSIIQISELWFEDSSDRNFFYNVIPNNQFQNTTNPNDVGNLLEPNQLSVYMAQPGFYRVIRRGANMYQNITDASVEIIISALNKDNYIESTSIPSDLWERQHIMLKLPVILERSILEDNLNLSKKNLDVFESTETLIVVPARDSDIELNVYVEDQVTKVYHYYRVDVNEVTQPNQLLTDYLGELSTGTNGSNYVSTLKNDTRYYDDNILLPLPAPASEIRYHDDLILEMPFANGEGVNEEQINDYVEHFFENPDIVNTFEIEGGLLFKELSAATVRYDFGGLVHYYHAESEEALETNISSAVTLAQNFIEKDVRKLSAEYFLREFEIGEDRITFYYDIGYNDFPIIMGEDLMELYELDKPYPIMVSVADDKVIEYKRILRMVDESIPQNRVLESRYEDALDLFIEEIGRTDVIISETYLGYKWSEYNTSMKLHWLVETKEGQRYFYEVD